MRASRLPYSMRAQGSRQTGRVAAATRAAASTAQPTRPRNDANGAGQQQQQPQQADQQEQSLRKHATTRPSSLPQNPYELLLEGKRFTCTECGKCCTGSGEVWLNSKECFSIARFLGLSEAHFLSRYTKAYTRKPGWRMLKVSPTTGDCVFLRDSKHCSIYSVRPLQCATYPWWPELMDPASWAAEGRFVCEGIEHEEALPVDAQATAPVLRAATDYFAEQAAAAAERGRNGHRRGSS